MYSNQSQMEGGLMRYRSAPSSFFQSLLAGEEFHHPQAENLMGRFFSGDSSESSCQMTLSPPTTTLNLEEAGPVRLDAQQPSLPSPAESGIAFQGASGFPPPVGHIGISNFAAASSMKCSLTRHSSSPAGFLSNFHLENGYSLTGGVGSFNLEGCSSGERGLAQRRLKSQLSFSRNDSPRSLISQLSDISMPDVVGSLSGNGNSDDGSLGSSPKCYMTSGGFPLSSWDETHPSVFGTSSRKHSRDINGEALQGFNDSQFGLATDMVSMEKLLHIQQDSVLCKIGAKRGCATHPRSIAERERRTRISEKLRKLQELVPNMDKQTNTADMLDLAVQYIKTLQNDTSEPLARLCKLHLFRKEIRNKYLA